MEAGFDQGRDWATEVQKRLRGSSLITELRECLPDVQRRLQSRARRLHWSHDAEKSVPNNR